MVNDMSFLIKCTVLGICFCFNAFAASTLLFGDQSIGAWQQAKERVQSLKIDLQNIDNKNAQLSHEIRLLQSDSSYLEKIIRQQLNYVKGDEIIYIFEQEQQDSYWPGATSND